jgi:hypothetical protein
VTVALVSSTASARQARSGAAAGGGTINSCSFLPKDLALKVTGTNKALFDLPPRETPVGNGSECNDGDTQPRIDPCPWASLQGMMKNGPKWTAVSGVGGEAYFSDNGRFAEFMGHVGTRTFTSASVRMWRR